MGFKPDAPLEVIDPKEAALRQQTGALANGQRAPTAALVDTKPHAGGFTPDAPSAPAPAPMDATTAANVAASKTPEKLPGPQDIVDMIRSVPEGVVPALKGLVSSLNPAENVTNLAHGIRSLISNPGAALEAVRNATPQQVGRNVVAPALVGAGVNEGAGLAAGAADTAGAAVANDAAQLGLRKAGPIAGHAADAGPVLSLQNQQVAKSALGADAGVPHNVSVNHAALDEAAKAPGQLLDQGTSLLPTAPLSPAAQAQVTAARGAGRITKGSPIVENYINDAESRLLDPNAQFSGEQIRQERNGMNADANAGMTSDDPDVRAKAKYQRAVVSALDQHVVDTMPANSAISPDMIANARATLAKNYNLRDLIGKGGDIDLQALAKDHRENPGKFTGPTRTVAQFASDHPEVTAPISNETRLSPPGLVSDLANVNPIKPIGSLAQVLFGTGTRRALRGAGNGSAALGAAEQTPVAGLAGEFEPKPLTSLAPPPGEAFTPAQRGAQVPQGRGLPFQAPLELNAPEGQAFAPNQPELAASSGYPQRGMFTFGGKPPVAPGPGNLGLAGEFPGIPSENNSELSHVMSQGVPEGTMQRSPRSSAPDFAQLGRPLANNASGESAASQEAISRTRGEAPRFVIDPDGNVTPLKAEGAAVADYKPPKGSIVVQGGGPNGKPTIIDRGGLPQSHATGLMARAFGRGGLGDEF